jgi:hypothetical protein
MSAGILRSMIFENRVSMGANLNDPFPERKTFIHSVSKDSGTYRCR